MTLQLDRITGESLMIGNDVVVTVVEINRNQVRLGFTAPTHVRVLRGELAKGLELKRIPSFSTHKDRLEQLDHAERDLPRLVHTVASLLCTASSEASRLQQPLAAVTAELRGHSRQRSQTTARKLLEFLKYLRQSLQAQIAVLSTHRLKAAAIVAPFAKVARLYDSSSQQNRLKQLYLADQDVARAVDGAVARLQSANDEASRVEKLLAESVPDSQPNDLRVAQGDTQKLAELLARLPEHLQTQAADLRLECDTDQSLR
jgi:carbon storage regulator